MCGIYVMYVRCMSGVGMVYMCFFVTYVWFGQCMWGVCVCVIYGVSIVCGVHVAYLWCVCGVCTVCVSFCVLCLCCACSLCV